MFRSLSSIESFSDIAGLYISLGFQQLLLLMVKQMALRNTALESRLIWVTRAKVVAIFIRQCVDKNHDSDFSLISHVCVKSLQSCPLFVPPWTTAPQAPLSMGFSSQEYWSGCHTLLQGIFLTLKQFWQA